VYGSEISTAEKRNGIGISTGIRGNSEKIRGMGIPADEEESNRQRLENGYIVTDLEEGSLGIHPLLFKDEGIPYLPTKDLIFHLCFLKRLFYGSGVS
jgi:hypothetical protein